MQVERVARKSRKIAVETQLIEGEPDPFLALVGERKSSEAAQPATEALAGTGVAPQADPEGQRQSTQASDESVGPAVGVRSSVAATSTAGQTLEQPGAVKVADYDTAHPRTAAHVVGRRVYVTAQGLAVVWGLFCSLLTYYCLHFHLTQFAGIQVRLAPLLGLGPILLLAVLSRLIPWTRRT